MTPPPADLPPPPPVLLPPAGWYPVDADQLGYWDGTRWTVLPAPAAPHTPFGEEERHVPTLRSWVGVVVGFGVAIGLTALVAFSLRDVDTTSNAWLVVGVVPIWLGLLAGCVVASTRSGISLKESWGLPRTRRGWFRAVGIGIGFGVIIRVVSGLAVAPLIPFIDEEERLPWGQLAPLLDVDTTFLWMFGLIAVVGAPLFEEAFFRGVLQTTLLGRVAVPVAVGVQGVVFGLIHYSFGESGMLNLMTVIAITVAGVGFGWLAWWSQTLVTAVVAHATFNAVALGLLIAYPWIEDVLQRS
jgi:membrane protease YdiL (CAAX protease family)